MEIDEKEFRTWLDKLFDRFPAKEYILISILSGLAFWIIGVLFSIIGGFFSTVIRMPHGLVASFGIGWVMSWLRWGRIEFFRILRTFPVSPDVDSDRFETMLRKSMKLVTNNMLLVTTSLLLTCFLDFVLINAWYLDGVQATWMSIPRILPVAWYTGPSLILKVLIIFIYSIPVCFLIATSGFQITVYVFRIMKLLSKSMNYDLPFVARRKLNSMGNLNYRIALTWFVGIALILSLFYKTPSLVFWVFLGILTLIGLLTFFVPQGFFHSTLKEKKRTMLEELGEKYEKMIKDLRIKNETKEFAHLESLFHLDSVYRAIEKSPTWVFDFTLIVKVLSTSLIPLLSMLSKFQIVRFFKN